jgi:cardiolipin synthase (CMP-forming)
MNLPNSLTVLRMLMVPVFLFFFFVNMENSTAIAFGIVFFAGFTDFLDGYIARKFKLITKFGTAMDPLADKLMLAAVLISLTVKQMIPLWILAIVMVKEATMILGAFVLHRHHEIVIPANKYGKMATIAFYVAIITIAFHAKFYMIFMFLFVLLTIFAFWTYWNNYRKVRNSLKLKGTKL